MAYMVWCSALGLSACQMEGTRALGVDPLSAELVAHWPMDEGTGDTTVDASGHGHVGTLVNGPEWGDRGLTFDGVDDYVDLGAWTITGEQLSLSAWFRSDDLANCGSRYDDCRIFSKAMGTQEQSHDLMLSTFKKSRRTGLRFRLKAGGTTGTLVASSGTIAEGRWVHAAAVYDGLSMRLYQDGVLVGQAAKSGLLTFQAAAPLWIGGNPPSGSTRPWNGAIDDVRIYRRALGAEEIKTLASGVVPPPNQAPVAHDASVEVEAGMATSVVLKATDADGDPLIYRIVSAPAHGRLAGQGPEQIYTADVHFSGSDSFEFEVDDSWGGTARARVSITVHPTVDPSLVAHWPMDEGTGQTTADTTGNGQTGLLKNGAVWSDRGISMDGVDDHVNVGSLEFSGEALTLSASFRSVDLANCSTKYHDCRIVSQAGGKSEQDHDFMVSTLKSGDQTRLRFRLRTEGATKTLIASSGEVTENEWVHVAAVYDGSSMRLYQNGTLVGQTSKSGNLTFRSGLSCWIGGNPPAATSAPWRGEIDDVRIYNRAVTEDEIAQLASTEAEPPSRPPPPPPSNPSECANGVIEAGEDCDIILPSGTDCRTLGFSGGELMCDGECRFDTKGCVAPSGQCNDGIDNDGDGLVDWQYDMGCYSAEDNTEGNPAAMAIDNGWTVFEPSNDSLIIYVSSSDGDDNNDGRSPDRPVKTITKGASLVRHGYHDFLLLKRGDVWGTELNSGLSKFKSGRDKDHPIVIASYGSSTRRPHIKLLEAFIGHGSQARSHIAVVGLSLIAAGMDPHDPAFHGSAVLRGLRLVGGGSNILIEDNKFRYMQLTVQSHNGFHYSNIRLRRNIVLDAWAPNSSHSKTGKAQGLYASGIRDGLLIEENVFDHNGWNEEVVDAGAGMYGHNIYLQSGQDGKNTIVRGNMFTRAASHGLQGRSGGLFENNLFVRNTIGLLIGGSNPLPAGVFAHARNNVILEGKRMDPDDDTNPQTAAVYGLGIGVTDSGVFTVERNIVAHRLEDGIKKGIADKSDVNYISNIQYDWGGGIGDMFDPNWPEPERSVASYHASLGKIESLEAFLEVVRNRSSGQWPEDYTAYVVNAYIRAGFSP